MANNKVRKMAYVSIQQQLEYVNKELNTLKVLLSQKELLKPEVIDRMEHQYATLRSIRENLKAIALQQLAMDGIKLAKFNATPMSKN